MHFDSACTACNIKRNERDGVLRKVERPVSGAVRPWAKHSPSVFPCLFRYWMKALDRLGEIYLSANDHFS